MTRIRNAGRLALGAGVLALVTACASHKAPNNAPVEDRSNGQGRATVGEATPAPVAAKPPPGIENAGKPGYYSVKPGDTLIRIGLDTGQNWRDIARWSGLDNPNILEVGQVLRVVPPSGESPAAVTKPVNAAVVTAAPLPPASGAAGVRPGAGAAATVVGAAANAVTPSAAPASAASAAAHSAPSAAASTASSEEELGWIWPTSAGSVSAGFDEVKNKGLDISGKTGDAVLATADGRVVYAGAGLRGYGNLVILKHNNTYLSAYAHNQILLVKEDQNVRKGQKIAEMGNTDADSTKLHFEIRRQGKPVDPAKYLPAR
jgi:lipoprotein NlpD